MLGVLSPEIEAKLSLKNAWLPPIFFLDNVCAITIAGIVRRTLREGSFKAICQKLEKRLPNFFTSLPVSALGLLQFDYCLFFCYVVSLISSPFRRLRQVDHIARFFSITQMQSVSILSICVHPWFSFLLLYFLYVVQQFKVVCAMEAA